jgi:hypothetical protein
MTNAGLYWFPNHLLASAKTSRTKPGSIWVNRVAEAAGHNPGTQPNNVRPSRNCVWIGVPRIIVSVKCQRVSPMICFSRAGKWMLWASSYIGEDGLCFAHKFNTEVAKKTFQTCFKLSLASQHEVPAKGHLELSRDL